MYENKSIYFFKRAYELDTYLYLILQKSSISYPIDFLNYLLNALIFFSIPLQLF